MDESHRQRFRDLYVVHYAAILGYCLRRIGRDQAHDAAAETFAVAWRRIGDVPDGDRALPWLYGVAAKTLCNQRRSQRRRYGLLEKLRGLGQVGVPTPDIQVVRRTEDQQIVDAINRLRRSDREILLLSAWEGLPAPQLAERFGISLSAAEQRLTRQILAVLDRLAGTDSDLDGGIGQGIATSQLTASVPWTWSTSVKASKPEDPDHHAR